MSFNDEADRISRILAGYDEEFARNIVRIELEAAISSGKDITEWSDAEIENLVETVLEKANKQYHEKFRDSPYREERDLILSGALNMKRLRDGDDYENV